MSAQRQFSEPEAPEQTGNVTQFPKGPRLVTLDLDNAQRTMEMLIQFRDEFLIHGVDWGTIPHTNGATLYKPGGEKLLHFFNLAFTLEVTRDEDWANGRVAYEVKTIVIDKKTGQVVAEGLGNCNSRERKYKNKDAAEVANTCLKMAKKRSLLDGVLTATRSSGLFEDGDDVKDEYRGGDRSRSNTQGNRSQSNQQRPQQTSAGPRAATRDELARCERARQDAVALGYRTGTGAIPKPIADGTPVNEAGAKCQRWETFIKNQSAANAALAERPEMASSLAETERQLELEAKAEPAQDPKGPRYQIPKHMKGTPPHNCTSCGASIYFIKSIDTGKTVPVNTDGYSHFTTCPNASAHSKKAAPKPEPAPTPGKQPLTNMQKRLWAVSSAANLPQAAKGAEKAERLEMCNQALTFGNFEPITSFAQLADNEAAYLINLIETGQLAWGQKAEVTA